MTAWRAGYGSLVDIRLPGLVHSRITTVVGLLRASVGRVVLSCRHLVKSLVCLNPDPVRCRLAIAQCHISGGRPAAVNSVRLTRLTTRYTLPKN